MADALRLCLAGLTLLLLCGCPEGEHSTIRVGNHEISVEVAADNATRRRGLMERESIPLPLSIAYADKQGTIVRIADLEPHSTDGVSSIRPALYALEMNRGWFKKNGVIEGDRLRKLPKVDVR
jgi:uncharacterized membrane protein (UPF0127 family)